MRGGSLKSRRRKSCSGTRFTRIPGCCWLPRRCRTRTGGGSFRRPGRLPMPGTSRPDAPSRRAARKRGRGVRRKYRGFFRSARITSRHALPRDDDPILRRLIINKIFFFVNPFLPVSSVFFCFLRIFQPVGETRGSLPADSFPDPFSGPVVIPDLHFRNLCIMFTDMRDFIAKIGRSIDWEALSGRAAALASPCRLCERRCGARRPRALRAPAGADGLLARRRSDDLLARAGALRTEAVRLARGRRAHQAFRPARYRYPCKSKQSYRKLCLYGYCLCWCNHKCNAICCPC